MQPRVESWLHHFRYYSILTIVAIKLLGTGLYIKGEKETFAFLGFCFGLGILFLAAKPCKTLEAHLHSSDSNCPPSIPQEFLEPTHTLSFLLPQWRKGYPSSDPKLFSHPCLLSTWGCCCGFFLCFASLVSYYSTQAFKEHSNILTPQSTNQQKYLTWLYILLCQHSHCSSLLPSQSSQELSTPTISTSFPFFLLPHQPRKTALDKVTVTFVLLNLTDASQFHHTNFLATFDTVDYQPVLKSFSLSPPWDHILLVYYLWPWFHRLLIPPSQAGFLNIRAPHGSILGSLLVFCCIIPEWSRLYRLLTLKCMSSQSACWALALHTDNY